jgi:hypothetical protein
LSFASAKKPLSAADGSWRLDRGRLSTNISSACLFARLCPDKLSVCERLEPANHVIQHKNQHALGPHCVKCHLYDEVNVDET